MKQITMISLAVVMLASCGGGSGASSSSGCEGTLVGAGEYEGFNLTDEGEQKYWVIVPDGYEESAPVPLYLHLASGGGAPDPFLAGWRPYLDDIDGLSVIVSTRQSHERSIETMRKLLDQLEQDYCIDTDRIHAIGTSSSSSTVAILACEEAERIASFGGGMGDLRSHLCEPERAVPLVIFTGDPDRHVVDLTVEQWTEFNGCETELSVADLGSGISKKTYQGCEGDVVYYDIAGMGHVWPLHECIGPGAEYCAAYVEIDYLDEVIAFFNDHPMP
jgi:poly(3-hydroxybutyrate) depolymerase